MPLKFFLLSRLWPCWPPPWSGLNLLVAAIILWNTRYLEAAYRELRRQGLPINQDLLRHVAPLGWEYIGLTGDYVWTHAGQIRPAAPLIDVDSTDARRGLGHHVGDHAIV